MPPPIEVRRSWRRRAAGVSGEASATAVANEAMPPPSPVATPPRRVTPARRVAVRPRTPSPAPPAAASPARPVGPRLRALAASLDGTRAALVRSTAAGAYGWLLEAAVEAGEARAHAVTAATAASETPRVSSPAAAGGAWAEGLWPPATHWAPTREGVAPRGAAAGPGPRTLASRLRLHPGEPTVQQAALAQLDPVLQQAEQMLDRGDDAGAAALYGSLLGACAAGETSALAALFVRSPLHEDPLLHVLGRVGAPRSTRVLLAAFARALRAQAALRGEDPRHARKRWHLHADALRLGAELAARALARAAMRREPAVAASAAMQLACLHRAAGTLGWDQLDAWPDADVAVAAACAAAQADALDAASKNSGPTTWPAPGVPLGRTVADGSTYVTPPAELDADGASAAVAWLEAQGCTEAAEAVAEADVASLTRQLWRLEGLVLRELAAGDRAGAAATCARLSTLRRAHPDACAGASGHGPARAVAAWLGVRPAVERGGAKNGGVLQAEAVVLPAEAGRAGGWLAALAAFGGTLAQLSAVPDASPTAVARVAVWTVFDRETGEVAPAPASAALACFARPPRLARDHAFGADAAPYVLGYVLHSANAELGGGACDLVFGDDAVAELRQALRRPVPTPPRAHGSPAYAPCGGPSGKRRRLEEDTTAPVSPSDEAAVAFLGGLRQRYRTAPPALLPLVVDEGCRGRLPPALVQWIDTPPDGRGPRA